MTGSVAIARAEMVTSTCKGRQDPRCFGRRSKEAMFLSNTAATSIWCTMVHHMGTILGGESLF